MAISAIADGSSAAASGVKAGDILLSVRIPADDNYYRICADMEEWVEFSAANQDSEEVSLLLLRNQDREWRQLMCQLGQLDV